MKLVELSYLEVFTARVSIKSFPRWEDNRKILDLYHAFDERTVQFRLRYEYALVLSKG